MMHKCDIQILDQSVEFGKVRYLNPKIKLGCYKVVTMKQKV